MSSSAPATDSTCCFQPPALSRQESKSSIDSRFSCNICLEAVVEPVVTQCGHLYCWPCLYRWLEPGMQPAERASLGLFEGRHAPNDSRRVCPVCKAPCSVSTLVPIYVRSNEPTPPKKEAAEREETDLDENDVNRRDSEDFSNISGANSSDAEPNDPQIEDFTPHNDTGLRQRLRFRSRDSEVSAADERSNSSNVPSRPPAMSPRASPSSSPTASPPPPNYRNNNPVWITPLSPSAHPASLTHGLLLSFQQQQQYQNGVPPLHRQDGTQMNEANELEMNPNATEYLSRLLIMLGSFVLLCLLLL